MKFTKILSLLLAVLMIAALFAGCAGETKPTEAQTEKQTEAQTEKQTEVQTEAQTEAQTETQTEVETDPQGETETQAEPVEIDVWLEVNGQQIRVGVPFAELEPMLPEETAPVQEIDSCDENSDWHQSTHTYDGFTITVNKDGVAVGINVVDGDYALNGTVKIGSKPDDVKAAFGTPDTDEAWGIYYYGTMPMLNFYLDEETGMVSGFGIMSEFVM